MVVIMLSEAIDKPDLQRMMSGDALPLSSSFRLRYNTLLRLYSTESLRPDTLVAQSFYAFQRAREVPLLNDKRDALLSEASSLNIPNETSLQLTLPSW